MGVAPSCRASSFSFCLRCFLSSLASTSITSLPRYVPQFAQSVCAKTGFAHFLQAANFGALRKICILRCPCLDFDRCHFGTAILQLLYHIYLYLQYLYKNESPSA